VFFGTGSWDGQPEIDAGTEQFIHGDLPPIWAGLSLVK
jgi:hypothetical protein